MHQDYKVLPSLGRVIAFQGSVTGTTIQIPAHWRGRDILVSAMGCDIYGALNTKEDPDSTPATSELSGAGTQNASTLTGDVVTLNNVLFPLAASGQIETWTLPITAYHLKVTASVGTGWWYITLKDFTSPRTR